MEGGTAGVIVEGQVRTRKTIDTLGRACMGQPILRLDLGRTLYIMIIPRVDVQFQDKAILGISGRLCSVSLQDTLS